MLTQLNNVEAHSQKMVDLPKVMVLQAPAGKKGATARKVPPAKQQKQPLKKAACKQSAKGKSAPKAAAGRTVPAATKAQPAGAVAALCILSC